MPSFLLTTLLAFAANQRDLFAEIHTALEAVPTDGDSNGGGEQQQGQPPQPTPALPVPFAGETSDAFANRYPDGFVCTVPTGLKYDPWHVIEQDGVFTRGAWIPLDALFTAPVA